MLPNQARNFIMAFLGKPLPVDEEMMKNAEDLKATIAGMTTESQRLDLQARYPAAHLGVVFAELPARKEWEPIHVRFKA